MVAARLTGISKRATGGIVPVAGTAWSLIVFARATPVIIAPFG